MFEKNWYIEINENRMNGCLEYKETGDISLESNQGENGAWMDYGDIKALQTIDYEDGVFMPVKISAVGYADVGGDTLIIMYGEDDGHGVQIAELNDNYFRECFNSGMSTDEIEAELTEMISDVMECCNNISIDKAEICVDHAVYVADKYLRDNEKHKSKDIER